MKPIIVSNYFQMTVDIFQFMRFHSPNWIYINEPKLWSPESGQYKSQECNIKPVLGTWPDKHRSHSSFYSFCGFLKPVTVAEIIRFLDWFTIWLFRFSTEVTESCSKSILTRIFENNQSWMNQKVCCKTQVIVNYEFRNRHRWKSLLQQWYCFKINDAKKVNL